MRLPALAFALVPFLMCAPCAASPEERAMELAEFYEEEEDYQFRTEAWDGRLSPEVGRGVRVQLFRGHQYLFCGVVERGSLRMGLLDPEGNRVDVQVSPEGESAERVVQFSPRATGVYVVLLSLEGVGREAAAAFVMGYR